MSTITRPIDRSATQDPYAYNNDLLLHVFEVALKVYIEDVKNLVQSTIEDELKPLVNSRDYAARNLARSRKISLKTWLKSKNPLSYEKDDFPHLLAALEPARNNNGVAFSLNAPPGEGRPISYFVAKIVDGAAKRREPPFIQDGMFQPVLSAAMELLSRLGARRHFLDFNPDNQRFKTILSRVVAKLKINHVPWAIMDPNPRAPGRPSLRVVHTVWLPLGAAEPARVDHTTQLNLTEPQMRQTEVMLSSEKIALKDARTSWSACHHRITNYHEILHKRVLPLEWGIRQASIPHGDDFCREVYDWVRMNIDLTNNPLHAIALFISHVFAGMRPHIFPPRTLGALKNSTPSQLANHVSNLPWETRPEKKGASLPQPFITMVSTFVIAVMDDRSPLARALQDIHVNSATPSQKTDVKLFYDKHSESSHATRHDTRSLDAHVHHSKQGNIPDECYSEIQTCDTHHDQGFQRRSMAIGHDPNTHRRNRCQMESHQTVSYRKHGVWIIRRHRRAGRRTHGEDTIKKTMGKD
ncbi:hypothetical protein JVT61DRAFT_9063 [Boletus reticuloceps]|uniref:Uncharacterized protein n=1 Tax=Boletus reticuloceps TaxID=495285 RepID=A0A8I3A673_9AGAM|nr:hypothetical protein JVT61DRAFT_9063 [Boletus reticuloceps]